MCFILALAYALALASVVSYNHKWRYNLEHPFTDDASSFNYDHNMFIIQAIGASF
jgi:hypothetical protein